MCANAWADTQRWLTSAAAGISHFEQQAKTEIGGTRGERLVDETSVGLNIDAAFAAAPWLEVGLFGRLDFGTREAGVFAGYDANDGAVTSSRVGGSFLELWYGPLARVSHASMFFELGWAPLAWRTDEGREDIVAADGTTDDSFEVTPSVAYQVAIGGRIRLFDTEPEAPRLLLRLNYRVRYYTTRGGSELVAGQALGSQDLTPMAGVMFTF